MNNENKNKKEDTNDFINGVIRKTIENAVKTMYDEMKKQGFSDVQSYDFAKSYMLMTIANGSK